jgi:glucose/mannose transport system substrate-binding protein
VLRFTNGDRDSIDWPQAALKVVDGAAAMTFAGEWAKSYFETAGLDPGTELGQIVFPETTGNFAYLMNAFALPRRAPHSQAALNFLSLIGKRDAANVFSSIKGTTPARIDVDRGRSDTLSQENFTDFRSSTLVLGHVAKIKSRDFLIELDATMRQFAIDGESMPVVNMLRNRYGQL